MKKFKLNLFKFTKILFLTVIFSCCFKSSAQSLKWALKAGVDGNDKALKVLTDDSGNLLVLGYFSKIVDFDAGSGTKALSSSGGKDVFLAKYKSDGSAVWALQLGGTLDDQPADFNLDKNGNIYITGSFKGTIDLDPGTSVAYFSVNGSGIGTFLVKLNTAGKYRWARIIQSTSDVVAKALATDGGPNVYIAGNAKGNISDFDIGTPVVSYNSKGSDDAFISSFDTSGNFRWVNTLGGKYDDWGLSLAVDSKGYVFAGGTMQDSVTIITQSGTQNIKNLVNFDGFIIKQDKNGKLIWVKLIEGNNSQILKGLKLDASGNIYAYGEFSGNTDFKPGTDTTFRNTKGGNDLFVAKYDSIMNLKWVSTFGGSDWEYVGSMHVSTAQNVYISGLFSGVADFDPSTSTMNLTSKGSSDIFNARINANGNLDWAYGMGSGNADAGNGIVGDKSGNVYACGDFIGTIDCDPGTGTVNLTSTASTSDCYILRLSDCSPSAASLTIKSCGTYVAPSGKKFTNTGKITDIISNKSGCDSVISIDLTVTNIDTSVIVNGGVITAKAAGAAYQWLNCATNFSIISGQTGQFYIPKTNGNYAVKITQNSCTDTSFCIVITAANSNSFSDPNVQIYPIPASDYLNIIIPETRNTLLKLYASTGQCVLSQNITGLNHRLYLTGLETGIYALVLSNSNGNFVRSIEIR